MDLNNEDMEFQQVTNLLKNLSKKQAPNDFETTLWQRINSVQYIPQYQEERWWEKFLLPQRLIPTAAAGLAIIILFFVFSISGNEIENPLIAQPRLRIEPPTSTIAHTIVPEVKSAPKGKVKIVQNKEITTETAETVSEEDNMPGQLYTSSDNNAASSNNGFSTASYSGSVNKSGYNFLQVRLNNQEKEKVNRLKNRISSYFNGQNR